ncbi:hypothetical protein C8Q79DRAFT_1010734 [Trametes meyenii]|nr:hypothetical protein C8Q79DRAFT_1010734 [Trametes meyenii]
MTYQDVRLIQEKQDRQNPKEVVSVVAQLPEKIRRFCEVAAEHNYDLAWVDSCCIDKTSSSELSEAINSMYDWYRYAGVCYVFLHDVATASTTAQLEARGSPFRTSRWHKRGWTLQELLAPAVVVFLSSEWRIIGSKHTLADLIEEVTGIDRDVLTFQRPLEQFSVACRMSWAAPRETTREEDEAYSLIGIFGVNMPTTYGEGRYAFTRLQEEILKHISDQTIFAWGLALREHNFSFYDPHIHRASYDLLASFSVTTSSPDQFLLASSPRDFRYSSNLVSIPWDKFMRRLGAPLTDRPTYTTTSYGVRTRLPLLSVRAQDSQTNAPTCIALLACEDANRELITLLLRSHPQRPDIDYYVGAVVGRLREIMGPADNIDPFSMTPVYPQYYFRTAVLSADNLSICRKRFRLSDIYIPYRPSLASHSLQRDVPLHSALRSIPSDTFELRVFRWSQELLKLQGYRITHHPGMNPFTIEVANKESAETIGIYVGRCTCYFGDKERYLSIEVSASPSERSSLHARPTPHQKDHEDHIQSWTFQNGAASKEFHVRSGPERRTTIRLTLMRSTESPHLFMLGVEVWKTRDEDIKRQKERLMSRVTGKSTDTVPRGRVHQRVAETSFTQAGPLQRTRSSSHPPLPVSPGSPTDSPPGGFTPNGLSPILETPTQASSWLMTPPVSRNPSWAKGVAPSSWGADEPDAESWGGFSPGSIQMDVDPPTPSPAGTGSQVPYRVAPSSSVSPPNAIIPSVSPSKIPRPKKAHSLNVVRSSLPLPKTRPSSETESMTGGGRRSESKLHPRDAKEQPERKYSLPGASVPWEAHGNPPASMQPLRESPVPEDSIQGRVPPPKLHVQTTPASQHRGRGTLATRKTSQKRPLPPSTPVPTKSQIRLNSASRTLSRLRAGRQVPGALRAVSAEKPPRKIIPKRVGGSAAASSAAGGTTVAGRRDLSGHQSRALEPEGSRPVQGRTGDEQLEHSNNSLLQVRDEGEPSSKRRRT